MGLSGNTGVLGRKVDRVLTRHLSGDEIDYRQVINIMIPILVDQAFIACLSLLNTAMISSAGTAAVSAVGMVDSLNVFLLNVFIALATGGTVIVAQYTGNGNREKASLSAAQAISAVALVALMIGGVIVLFPGPILNLLFSGAEPDVFNYSKMYFIGSGISYPFIGIVNAVCCDLRGKGETKPSLVLSIITNLSSVAFNFLFITLLGWGIMGLCIATVASRVLGAVCSILYLLKLDHTLAFTFQKALHLDFSMQKRIFLIGIPFAAEQVFFNGGKLITQIFIVQLGTLAIAVNTIANSIFTVLTVGGNAASLALVTVVGQCMGRRNVKDSRKFTKSFQWIARLFYIALSLMMLPMLSFLIQLFSPPAEIVPTIRNILYLCMAGTIVLWPCSFVTPSALRAAGDSNYTSLMSMLSMWFFRVVLGYVLGIVLDFGIIGVWVAMILEWGVRDLIFILRIRGEKWYQHNVID